MKTAIIVTVMFLGAFNVHAATLQAEQFEEFVTPEVSALGEFTRAKKFAIPNYSAKDKANILKKYSYLDPKHLIDTDMLSDAVLYYEWNFDKIDNTSLLCVLDFSLHSSVSRFFIINMKTGAVESHHVAHGTNSDVDDDGLAESFSNKVGSLQSSLGFYYTAETYVGKNGRSLRMDGLSTTNSNVRDRAVVIHGADYVWESDVKQGRTWGCFGFAEDQITGIIDQLEGGTLILAASK